MNARWFPGLAAFLAIVACYGTLGLVAGLSLLGVTLDIPQGPWAGAITLFAWLALGGVLVSFRRHRGIGPVILAAAGVVLITWVMFVSFSRALELLGFASLISAALWDRRCQRCEKKRP